MKHLELRLDLREEDAVLMLSCIKERAMEAEDYRHLFPGLANPRLPTRWDALARTLARAILEAKSGTKGQT